MITAFCLSIMFDNYIFEWCRIRSVTGMSKWNETNVFTLDFPDRPVHSDTISASMGSIQPYAKINARRLLVHISTTVYSQLLIYSAEWTGAM